MHLSYPHHDSHLNSTTVPILAGVGLLGLVPLLGVKSYILMLLVGIIGAVIMAVGWNIISGYGGYISFGHVIFYGTGAYAAAIASADYAVSWPIALVAALLATVVIALFVSVLLLRLSGTYFAIGTFLAAEGFRFLIQYTRGSRAIFLTFGISNEMLYWVAVGGLLVTLLGAYSLLQSRFGVKLGAIKEDELAAEALGIPTTRIKTLGFVLSALPAGLFGAITAMRVSVVEPSSAFNVIITLDILIYAFIGGLGTFWGPVVGAIALETVGEFLWASSPAFHLAIQGFILVLISLFLPEGVWTLIANPREAGRLVAGRLRKIVPNQSE